MKERPILFSGPMVRAILEGRKTQTRRVVKDLIWHEEHDLPCMISDDGPLAFPERFYDGRIKCPHGTVGDRLWVREAWNNPAYPMVFPSFTKYRADYHTGLEKRNGDEKWRPSIHMPRWASRITLEITGVRVERLQKITHRDAIAEGIPKGNWSDGDRDPCVMMDDPRDDFMELWQSINGLESWSANPWVWVIEFRRVQT